MSARGSARGFTLLEVLVAVAILGLGLTAILSAQFSAVGGVAHARGLSGALGPARCKMSEIEERLAREGFAELDEHETGPCCGEEEASGYSCEWHIDKPVFPEPELGELDLDAKLEGDGFGALGKLAEAGQGQEVFAKEGGLDGAASTLAGDLGEVAAGGLGGVASLVMGLVYPDLKALFEASARRITVLVHWREGSRDEELVLVQWLTRPQPPPLDAAALAAGGVDGLSSTGAPGTANEGKSTTTSPSGGGRR